MSILLRNSSFSFFSPLRDAQGPPKICLCFFFAHKSHLASLLLFFEVYEVGMLVYSAISISLTTLLRWLVFGPNAEHQAGGDAPAQNSGEFSKRQVQPRDGRTRDFPGLHPLCIQLSL